MKYKAPKPKPQHNFSRKVGRTTFWACWHCGLIPLNNEKTRRAINAGCVEDGTPINKEAEYEH